MISFVIRVTGVLECRGGYELRLSFSDGSVGDLDLSDDLWGEVFEPLRDPALVAGEGNAGNRVEIDGSEVVKAASRAGEHRPLIVPVCLPCWIGSVKAQERAIRPIYQAKGTADLQVKVLPRALGENGR